MLHDLPSFVRLKSGEELSLDVLLQAWDGVFRLLRVAEKIFSERDQLVAGLRTGDGQSCGHSNNQLILKIYKCTK